MENQKSVLTFENGKFYFIPANKADVDLAKQFALKNDSSSLHWETRNIKKAKELRAFADSTAEVKFKSHFITTYERPDFIKYPDHLQPHTFQMESTWHALTRTPAYIADEPGLGKTITSILCINTVPGRTLIICPPYLKYNWVDELNLWLDSPRIRMFVDVFENGGKFDTRPLPDIFVVPDSIISNANVLQYLRRQKYKWLFVDEAHRYKEITSKRTRTLIEDIIPLAERTVFLSGTPMPNTRPIELWPILSNVAPEVIDWEDKMRFGRVFCGAKEVVRYEGSKAIREWDFTGRSNLEDFGELLRHKFMIRHEKKDVLKELPPKIRQFIFLDKPKRIEKYEKSVLRNTQTLSDLLGDSSNLGDVARFRRECGLLKIKPSAEFIEDQLEALKQPHLIFAYHIDVVQGLARALSKYNPIVIRGGLTPKQKNERIKTFKERSDCQLLIGNIDSMGTGLTLTKAKEVIFPEYSWVPGINEQAEDRIHRMTQESSTRFRYLILRNSLDERQLYSVLSKQQDSAKVMSKRKVRTK